jgi:hypothetical protein
MSKGDNIWVTGPNNGSGKIDPLIPTLQKVSFLKKYSFLTDDTNHDNLGCQYFQKKNDRFRW